MLEMRQSLKSLSFCLHAVRIDESEGRSPVQCPESVKLLGDELVAIPAQYLDVAIGKALPKGSLETFSLASSFEEP